MPNLSNHIRLSNTQRFTLAQEAFRDLYPSPFTVREPPWRQSARGS
jgi:hypothetical protein